MTDRASSESEPTWNGNASPGSPDRPRSGLLSIVAGPDERPACTIYPPDVAVPFRTTTWITAYGDAFVDLNDCQ
ncbi:DUF7511 domain-containing protein [Haloprofundus marisrubri]